jgi:serine/threonine protein kinase
LEELINIRGQLSLPTIIQIGRQLLAQISILIQREISHNDVKPANILFGLAEKRKQIFLIDYGFAANSKCLEIGVFRGNLTFSASRKLKGDYGYDQRNDL